MEMWIETGRIAEDMKRKNRLKEDKVIVWECIKEMNKREEKKQENGNVSERGRKGRLEIKWKRQ